MKKNRIILSLILASTSLLYTSCSQPEDLVYLNEETVMDVDSNIYHTVTINGQVWMTENLKTTRYRNGDLIDVGPIKIFGDGLMDLSKEDKPSYQWPCNGSEDWVPKGGRLYTWYAATDSRNICPEGWHLPSDKEWESLMKFLKDKGYGKYDKKGNRKSSSGIGIALASYSLWAGTPNLSFYYNDIISNNYTEHNTTGFSAIPSGCYFGGFVTSGYLAIWRSTSPNNSWSISYLDTELRSGVVEIGWSPYSNRTYGAKPWDGYSIRCIKDY